MPTRSRTATRTRLRRIHDRLSGDFGPQHWWPARTPFEVMVGAVLTQNTAWVNVERAIARLRAAGRLDPGAMAATPPDELAALIRPSGYFNVKARRLLALVAWYREVCGGRIDPLRSMPTAEARASLLEVRGVGEETADSILLYAAEHPVFVVDAYTRRIFSRLGLLPADASYGEMQALFMDHLPHDVSLFNEYHALIVALGKEICRPTPRCEACPLRRMRHG
jgi:endonuclease-3 related protein